MAWSQDIFTSNGNLGHSPLYKQYSESYHNTSSSANIFLSEKTAPTSQDAGHNVLWDDFQSTYYYNYSEAGDLNTSTDIPSHQTTDFLNAEKTNQLYILNYWINGVITNIIVILGLTGNVLTIIILSQRAMRSSTNYYLSALAVWDSIVLICTELLIGLPEIPSLETYKTHALAYVISYIYPIALIAQTATIWLTVSFTVERYIAVCHPLKAASMCTIFRAKIVIIGVSVGSALYNCPRWFDYWPVATINEYTNKSIVRVNRTQFSQNPIYLQVYFSWLYVPIMCIVPLLVLSILNMFLILAVRRSQRQRKDMNVKQSRENNVTIMLVSVVIVFIICQVPALVYNLAYAIDNDYIEDSFGYEVLSSIRNFLVTLNSAINFLLYCALGQKFRRIFLHTFFRRCINDTYIPMSGMHNPSTVINMPIQKSYYKSRNFPIRHASSSTSSNHSCSNASNVHGTILQTQESNLMTSDIYNATMAYPKSVLDRNMMTYDPPKDKRNQFHRSQDFIDSDEDDKPGLDTLLLCENNSGEACSNRFCVSHNGNANASATPHSNHSLGSSTHHTSACNSVNPHRHSVIPTISRLNGKAPML